jgi:hypothetical protein
MAKNLNFKLDSNKLGTNPLAESLKEGQNWSNWNDRSGDAV